MIDTNNLSEGTQNENRNEAIQTDENLVKRDDSKIRINNYVDECQLESNISKACKTYNYAYI